MDVQLLDLVPDLNGEQYYTIPSGCGTPPPATSQLQAARLRFGREVSHPAPRCVAGNKLLGLPMSAGGVRPSTGPVVGMTLEAAHLWIMLGVIRQLRAGYPPTAAVVTSSTTDGLLELQTLPAGMERAPGVERGLVWRLRHRFRGTRHESDRAGLKARPDRTAWRQTTRRPATWLP